jgi:hypothetical protein
VIRHTHTDTLSGRELLDLALPTVLQLLREQLLQPNCAG